MAHPTPQRFRKERFRRGYRKILDVSRIVRKPFFTTITLERVN
jgi:hypothetical protein